MTGKRKLKGRKSGWRRVGWAAVSVLLLIMVVIAVKLPDLRAQAELATAFGARTACVCHHIGGRPLADCRKDFEPGMEVVSIAKDGPTIRASVPLLGESSATFREGWGCQIEPYVSPASG